MAENPSLTFFIHPKFWPRAEIPGCPDIPWSGFNFGIYTWTIQTWLRLKQAGVECHLTSELPACGIVFAHRECLVVDGERVAPTRHRFLVNMAADLALYPTANLQIVQNVVQARWYPNCIYVPHWPEPGLVQGLRCDSFQNLVYFGNEKNLAPELRCEAWLETISQLGLRWIPRTGTFQYDNVSSYKIGGPWTDASRVDAIIAIRQFTTRPAFDQKPPSKLLNAWIIGVPAILGCESAYRHLRTSDLDYCEVKSMSMLVETISRLRDDEQLRTNMRDWGFLRAREFSPEAITESWIRIIEGEILPRWRQWLRAPAIEQKTKLFLQSHTQLIHTIRKKVFHTMKNRVLAD